MADHKMITRAELVERLNTGTATIKEQRAAASMLERDKMAYDDLRLRNHGLRFANEELRQQLAVRRGGKND